TERPPLTWMSRWRRFFTTLASGITWNQMRGPPPAGSMMLSAPLPSSLSGSPRSRRPWSPGPEPSGGGSSEYPRAPAQKRASSSGSWQSMTSWNRAGIVLPSVWQYPGAGMSGEAKAVLGQVVFDDPKGFGAHAMEFGQFCAGETRELTQG